MGAAVFLKDRGYDVLVLEKEEQVGGNCDTHYFNAPVPGTPNWLDYGVRVYFDNKALDENGIGEFVFNMRHYVERFVGASNIQDVVIQNLINYVADFSNGVNASSSPIPGIHTEEQANALIRLLIILKRYSFIEDGNYPDHIPQELSVPFSQFVAENQLESLYPIYFRAITNYNSRSFDEMPAINALFYVSTYNIYLIAGGKIGFTVNGGCQTLYGKIAEHLGRKQLKTNVQITGIKRSNYQNRQDELIKIEYTSNIEERVVKCRNLVMAIPPYLDNLKFMDLSVRERNLFSQIHVANMYLFTLEVEGGIADTGFNNVLNFNLLNPNASLTLPSITVISRDLPYGPAMVNNSYIYKKLNVYFLKKGSFSI
jgi:hypothetical protein